MSGIATNSSPRIATVDLLNETLVLVTMKGGSALIVTSENLKLLGLFEVTLPIEYENYILNKQHPGTFPKPSPNPRNVPVYEVRYVGLVGALRDRLHTVLPLEGGLIRQHVEKRARPSASSESRRSCPWFRFILDGGHDGPRREHSR